MGNKFLVEGEQRAAKVNDLFTRIAPRYDLINDVQSFGLHRRWKKRVVQMAQAKPGARVLDLCCGTGDIALGLASQGAKVVGLDFSARMLEFARARAEQRRGASADSHSLSFVQGDAQKIPFESGSFDAVTIGYGLRNLASWETGLLEMRRVAKPGGRIVILEFGKPDNWLWRQFYFGYLKICVPILGLVFCGEASAYSYILESLKLYPGQRGVAEKMTEFGLRNVRVVNLLGGAMSINYGELNSER